MLIFFHMKGLLIHAALLAVVLSTHAEVVSWKLSGELNYVHPALSEQFTVGDTYTMTLNVENGIPAVAIDRPFFYSVGNFDDSLIDGSLAFANGYTMELGGHSPGSFNIINAGATSASGYDQLNLSFQAFDDSLTGEPVAGYSAEILTLNFTDDVPPLNLLSGSEAAFPAYDLPFPSAETFHLEETTNERFHLRLQFAGGQPDGTHFVRGSITEFLFTDSGHTHEPSGGGNFEEAIHNANLPEEAKAFNADANGDGIPNGIAYALGIPLLGASDTLRYRLPTFTKNQWRIILPLELPADIAYEIRVSTTLGGDWTAIASRPINGTWEGAVDIASTDKEQTVSADVSVNLNHHQAVFFSLRVTLNP